MNIFVLSLDPKEAAQNLCDKHVIKMVLETAQILCSVLHKNNIKARYKSTHENHPCTIWAGKSLRNWEWLVNHGIEIGNEYNYRYGKIHKSSLIINECGLQSNRLRFDNNSLTQFVQAMPIQYRSENVVESYRQYYINEKNSIAKWEKKRQPPNWWRASK